jgi:hypothetical protein
MSDELRDRIAYELAGHQIVERTVRVVDHGAGEVRIPETRVVGKWER